MEIYPFKESKHQRATVAEEPYVSSSRRHGTKKKFKMWLQLLYYVPKVHNHQNAADDVFE